MASDRINKTAAEMAKFILSPDNVKLDFFAKYALMGDAAYGGAGFDIIKNNAETFVPLLAQNVVHFLMSERGKPVYNKAVQTNPRIGRIFSNESSVGALRHLVLRELNINNVNDFETYDTVMNGIELFGVENTTKLTDEEAKLINEIDKINIDIDFDDEEIDTEKIEFEDELDFGDEGEEGYNETINQPGHDEVNERVAATESNENTKSNETTFLEEVEGYNEKIHGGYRKQIENLILSAWEDLYSYHVDGKEIVDGFLVPGGTILGTGETIKYEGVLTLNTSKIVVKPNTMSNAVFEEFVAACKDYGVYIMQEVADNPNEVKPFKYNPMLQRRIASGEINKEAFKGGWKTYAHALAPYITKKTKELAIKRAETGSDEEIYRTLSGYIISLMVVNYKDALGTQLRICCGDTSKTAQVAKRLVERLRNREKTHKSIAQGKMVVSNEMISSNGLSAIITIYQNMEGYQAVPQFMGTLLCNMQEGMFKPSLNNMVIGLDMKNNIVTAPFTGWLLPIIAGSRSGKGVLTLNMLLNVIGGGSPLFYLDGKPDMAALLWKLQQKYNIPSSIVIDGIGYKGITDIDRKPYTAPYANNIQKMMMSPTSDKLLRTNFGIMIYLKTMLVILLACEYYKTHMRSKYGELFVVLDEVYKVMKTQMEVLILNIRNEESKLERKDTQRKAELTKIESWVKELLSTFRGNDIGVFGAGIKAVALTQFAQVTSYGIQGFTPASDFCKAFLLTKSVKLFGRQEGGSGQYGIARDRGDEVTFELYDKYFHFGIGTEQGNTYNNIKTFKPLLVLNENDCKELTGESKDGAFTDKMISRVEKFTDIDKFRETYFGDKRLAESIGFEGALSEVGRLLGVDWTDMLRKSLTRSYEIANEALRYYGIIGVDNIESVHDFICSFDIKHLWSFNEIIDAKATGKGLNGENSDNQHYEESIFAGGATSTSELNEGDQIEEYIDFGADKPDTEIHPQTFGGNKGSLTEEEIQALRDIEARKQQARSIEEAAKERHLEFEDIETIDEDDNFNNINDFYDIESETLNTSSSDPRPSEGVRPDEEPSFKQGGKTGKRVDINPNKHSNVYRLTSENSIMASLDDHHPLEKFERGLFKTLKGANYEFSKRWDAILSAITKRINPDLVTRVMLVQDEMYVNGRLVATQGIVGGFANVRLEDLVNFKKLFKKFRNIGELTLDMAMVERFQIEQPNLPIGFFAFGKKLLKVGIILENGTKEVIDRSQAVNKKAEEVIKQAKHRAQFEAVCAAKNPRLREKSPGYQGKVWQSTKSFGDKGWSAITHQLTKENPSFIKATLLGALTIGVVGVGVTLHGIGSLFNMFRR